MDSLETALRLAVAERQERLSALDSQIRAAKTAPRALDLEVRRLEVEAKKRINDLRALLDRSGEEGRKVIGALFEGPLTCTPVETTEGPRYRVKGRAVIGRMLTAEVSNVASPAGFEPETRGPHKGGTGPVQVEDTPPP